MKAKDHPINRAIVPSGVCVPRLYTAVYRPRSLRMNHKMMIAFVHDPSALGFVEAQLKRPDAS